MGRPKPLLTTPSERFEFGRVKLHKVSQKAPYLGVAPFFFFKRPLPRVFCPLNGTLRGFGGPTVANPRAEGGRGEVNLPPQSLLLGVLTRRTEGRRILVVRWLTFGALLAPFAPFWLTFGALWLTFGALGLTFGHPETRFFHFWYLLASFVIFFYF